jgi:Zn finger protein HypA/HybF involved in hydrogenase expression
MAIFRIEVTAIAKTTYTVEVDAPTEAQAESVAASREIFNANTTEEFQVDARDCEFEFETEQLTEDCEECGESYPVSAAWSQDRYICASCGAKIEAIEAAEAVRNAH